MVSLFSIVQKFCVTKKSTSNFLSAVRNFLLVLVGLVTSDNKFVGAQKVLHVLGSKWGKTIARHIPESVANLF